MEGHCRDLSEGGIGLLLARDLDIGDVAGLNFSLSPFDEPWDVRAVIRHRHGYHYGLEFLTLGEEQKANLRKHFRGQEEAE